MLANSAHEVDEQAFIDIFEMNERSDFLPQGPDDKLTTAVTPMMSADKIVPIAVSASQGIRTSSSIDVAPIESPYQPTAAPSFPKSEPAAYAPLGNTMIA